MNAKTVEVLRSVLKDKAHELLCILEDLARHDDGLEDYEALAAIGLFKMAEWEDTTCSYVELLAADYSSNDRNEVQVANLKTVRNFLTVFGEE